MQICDAHVHLGKSGPWQPYYDPTISVADLLRLFNVYNVERAVVFPNPNVGDKYPEMNDYIAKSMRKHPDRLVGFGRVDPRREDAIEELTRIKNQLRLVGLKLHPMVECFRPDHPFFNRFFHEAGKLGLLILFHTGDGFSSPALVTRIAKKYPKLPLILGHLKEGALSMMEQFDNFYVETSGTLPDIIELATDIDEDRILFGSDVPYYRYPTQIAIVEASRIAQKTKRKVFYENFQRLFTQE
jgi:predicted TIM-barrel fold metal-dependent hydrolase